MAAQEDTAGVVGPGFEDEIAESGTVACGVAVARWTGGPLIAIR
jgi:hypothetical protein